MTEAQHQINVIKWSQQPSIREKWPCLALLYHIKNETAAGTRQVMIDRKMGVKKGAPDLHLPVARGKYHSLYIEMKTESGTPSPEQLWWGKQLAKEGNAWEICHGWTSAVRVIEWYLNLSEPR